MDSILAEIYSTVLTAAPYVIVAYVGIFVVLAIFVVVVYRKLVGAEKQMAILEESLDLVETDAESAGK